MTLDQWLLLAVPSTSPVGVIAYSFNMSECGDWLIEVVGTHKYDPADPDWVCPPEQWTSRPLQFTLTRDMGGDTWEHAQAYVVAAVANLMTTTDLPQAQVLRAATAVCVGFVDGDLQPVTPRAFGP